MNATRSQFRRSALLSLLVTQEQLDEASLTAGVSADGTTRRVGEVDDQMLANRLVEMGILTAYQAEKILEGRTKLSLGAYTVTAFIGKGGMGEVYKGVHSVMGRECAIKVLPLRKATPESVANFNREVRTQAQLDHPNLVRAYDAGRDGATHYLVVEYVPGVDLRKLVRTQGRLTEQQAASVILQAAGGLEYAHKRGLVHRDIKPGNILVTPEGIAKVSDLGLAGYIHDAENDPRSGKIVGTADYLAPEHIRSPNDISHLADIYALGCTLYYSVCGKVPFPGGTARDKARRHQTDTPWHPRRFNADLNEEFVEVIADMMDKDPKTRIQSATEVVARLEQWAGEALPLGSLVVRSPWSAAPVSIPHDDELRDAQDTDGSEFSASGAEASAGQLSQGTFGMTSVAQDTQTMRGRGKAVPGLQPIGPALSPTAIISRTLLVAIPVSMLAGALITAIVFSLFW